MSRFSFGADLWPASRSRRGGVLIHANPVRGYPTSVGAMFASLWRNRDLILQLTSREILGRYRGSVMGLAWSFFNPLLMLLVYTFVFSVVFKARWGASGEESKADFAIVLFVGLIIHGLFADCVIRAPYLILANVNFVKKVIFPLEILGWVVLGSALFHSGISVVMLLTAQVVVKHTLPWTVVFLPLVILPLSLGIMGVCWVLSSMGVYLRDVGQTVGIFTTALMFLAPVFYPISALPEQYRSALLLNPLTFIIEESRRVVIWGELPDWRGLAIYTLISLLVAWLGFWWFQKTRRGFADVV
jgi:lipopolysaccharide transport system permease protein